jgi:hypothetical protein
MAAKENHGVLAEFKTPGDLLKAAEALSNQGFKKFDAYSPFPIHGMDRAMKLGSSRLTFIIFLCGISGGLSILYLMWWVNTIDYPLNISGKPFAAWPAYVPVTFEITVLLSAFGAVFGMLGLNKLPRFWDALFSMPRFERATSDGFFIHVEAEDPKFNATATPTLLTQLGGTNVEAVNV